MILNLFSTLGKTLSSAADLPISSAATFIFIELVVIKLAFIIVSLSSGKKQRKVSVFAILLCLACAVWLCALIGMHFIPETNYTALWILDSISYLGISTAPVFMLMVSLCIVRENHIPKYMYFSFLAPLLTNIMVWTNPLHHFVYKNLDNLNFTLKRGDMQMGWYKYVHAFFCFAFLLVSIVLMFRYALKKKSKNIWGQTISLAVGAVVPMIVSAIYIFVPQLEIGIDAAPMTLVVSLICGYEAFYHFHAFDIVPFASQVVLDSIGDSYIIVDEERNVVGFNTPFAKTLGKVFKFKLMRPLDSGSSSYSYEMNEIVATLTAQIKSCELGRIPISYEQIINYQEPDSDEDNTKHYYIIDIAPLEEDERVTGFTVIFKDVTQIRTSLNQVQENKERMLEQERLAMLGQMMGGFAHNLRTPIMSIAGATSSIETLMQEVNDSLGDPEVTPDDYKEIVNEVYSWTEKIRTSCSYMNEIITAIKNQTTNATNGDGRAFSISETLKCADMLTKHEMNKNGCKLVIKADIDKHLTLNGDMNSMTQIIGNLVVNAADAVKDCENKQIILKVEQFPDSVKLSVIDHGPGISPEIRKKLFHEMVTTKGSKGTGLGLYISASVIHGKFGGEMWIADHDQGTEIGFTVPLNYVSAGEDKK